MAGRHDVTPLHIIEITLVCGRDVAPLCLVELAFVCVGNVTFLYIGDALLAVPGKSALLFGRAITFLRIIEVALLGGGRRPLFSQGL